MQWTWAGISIVTALGPHSPFSLRLTHCPVVAWAPDVLLGPCNQLLKVLRATGVRSQVREGGIFVVGKDVMYRMGWQPGCRHNSAQPLARSQGPINHNYSSFLSFQTNVPNTTQLNEVPGASG